MKFIYLASPLSHPSKEVQQRRYEAVFSYIIDTLPDKNYFVYSPIVYHYPMAQAKKLPHDFEFWGLRDVTAIKKSDELWVLTLDGWEASIGVRAEVEYAKQLEIPIKYFEIPNV